MRGAQSTSGNVRRRSAREERGARDTPLEASSATSPPKEPSPRRGGAVRARRRSPRARPLHTAQLRLGGPGRACPPKMRKARSRFPPAAA